MPDRKLAESAVAVMLLRCPARARGKESRRNSTELPSSCERTLHVARNHFKSGGNDRANGLWMQDGGGQALGSFRVEHWIGGMGILRAWPSGGVLPVNGAYFEALTKVRPVRLPVRRRQQPVRTLSAVRDIPCPGAKAGYIPMCAFSPFFETSHLRKVIGCLV
jgi:hypothetical protein